MDLKSKIHNYNKCFFPIQVKLNYSSVMSDKIVSNCFAH